MNARLPKINKHIQRTFGQILPQEVDLPPDVLVTVSSVDTTPNLRSTTIWLYIFPLTQAPPIMALLERHLYQLQGALNRELAMRPLPRIRLQLDHGAEHASNIDAAMKKID